MHKKNNIELDNETLKALNVENQNYIDVPNKITQEEADWSLGYSKEQREQDEKNMQEIRTAFDNDKYFTAFAKV